MQTMKTVRFTARPELRNRSLHEPRIVYRICRRHQVAVIKCGCWKNKRGQ